VELFTPSHVPEFLETMVQLLTSERRNLEMSGHRLSSLPARRSWPQQIPQPGAPAAPRLPESNTPLLPGLMAAVNSLSAWMAERRATGSRWFGPRGFFGQGNRGRFAGGSQSSKQAE
jgi:hypothetical protein